MHRLLIALTVLLLTPVLGKAQSPLVGVWEMTAFTNAEGESFEVTLPAYSAWFDNGYFVLMWEVGEEPRPTYGDNASDAELLAAWQPFVAIFGTYVVEGSTYTRTNLVAKDPSTQGDVVGPREFRVDGNTLVTGVEGGTIYTYRRVR